MSAEDKVVEGNGVEESDPCKLPREIGDGIMWKLEGWLGHFEELSVYLWTFQEEWEVVRQFESAQEIWDYNLVTLNWEFVRWGRHRFAAEVADISKKWDVEPPEWMSTLIEKVASMDLDRYASEGDVPIGFISLVDDEIRIAASDLQRAAEQLNLFERVGRTFVQAKGAYERLQASKPSLDLSPIERELEKARVGNSLKDRGCAATRALHLCWNPDEIEALVESDPPVEGDVLDEMPKLEEFALADAGPIEDTLDVADVIAQVLEPEGVVEEEPSLLEIDPLKLAEAMMSPPSMNFQEGKGRRGLTPRKRVSFEEAGDEESFSPRERRALAHNAPTDPQKGREAFLAAAE